MKRIFALVLLFCLAAAAGLAADYNPYVPEQLTRLTYELLPLTIEATGADQEIISEAMEYLRVEKTDLEEQTLYYDNADWKVEFGFFFYGEAGEDKNCDAVNLILSKELPEDEIGWMLYAFATAVSYGDEAMDADALYDWMIGEPDLSNVYETTVGEFTNMPNDSAIQIAMVWPRNVQAQNKNKRSHTVVLPGAEPAPSSAPVPASAPAPVQAPVQARPADENVLIEAEGIQIIKENVEPYASRTFPAGIRINCRVVNNTRDKVKVIVDACTVNGEGTHGYGIYSIEPGTEKSDWLLLRGETEAGIRAVCNADRAWARLELRKDSNNELIATKEMNLDLSHVPSFTPYPAETTAAPTAKANATPRPAAPAQRTIQWLAFSERGWAEWDNESANRLKIRFEVTSKQYPIKSFDMYIYATNFMGERIYGDTFVYNWTTNRAMTDYRTAYSDWVRIPERKSIDRVYCGIKRVTLRDGTTEEVPDSDVEYYYWTIK